MNIYWWMFILLIWSLWTYVGIKHVLYCMSGTYENKWYTPIVNWLVIPPVMTALVAMLFFILLKDFLRRKT